jgi:GWxTD domain-containing protein
VPYPTQISLWGRLLTCGRLPISPAGAVLLSLFLNTGLQATWLETVSPLIAQSEKKAYLSLSPPERRTFEESFWTSKSISEAEYLQRLNYIDSTFGSNKLASGANTDPGRVYLSLGAPTRITHIPSSRIFVPLEIWYYDTTPGVIATELRLIFYQKNSVGYQKLYSPTLDTIRALLLPSAGTNRMFGPNDSTSESDIRKILKVGPAEDEVITAAVGVASGVKYSGNDEILGRITSPQLMLSRPLRTEVTSRFSPSRPALDVLETASPYGCRQIDLRLTLTAQNEVGIEVLQGEASVYRNQLRLKFAKPESIEYTHRLDLLPGSYRLMFSVDGKTFAYPLEIAASLVVGEILKADVSGVTARLQTPFEFDAKSVSLNPEGRFAIVPLASPGKVTWTIRKNTKILQRSTVDADRLALFELPPGGGYSLEMAAGNGSRTLEIPATQRAQSLPSTAISFNANLAPASRLGFIGHQWLLRGDLELARQNLETSLAKHPTDQAQVDLARADALTGNLDAARDRVSKILAAQPNHFEALSVLAYIEARLQDYTVAADLYRRALAVQDSPALRVALAKLPTQ